MAASQPAGPASAPAKALQMCVAPPYAMRGPVRVFSGRMAVDRDPSACADWGRAEDPERSAVVPARAARPAPPKAPWARLH